jgi:cellulose synthase/poly-beta-1,6-N-acetylglucosamine synthase-like glycosyltransferase
MLEYLFWGAISLVFFSYVGYPVTLVIYSGLVQAKRDIYFVLGKASKRSANSNPADLPSVAIIISAFNEANCIEARVRNLEALDYPKDKIKYYIGSDGSSDDTRNILSAIDDPNLVFVNFESK